MAQPQIRPTPRQLALLEEQLRSGINDPGRDPAERLALRNLLRECRNTQSA